MKKKPSMPKWRTVFGLVIMYIAIFFDWNWMWGLLYLYWVLPDLFTGQLHFIESIYRKENPILFWTTSLTFLAVSLYVLIEPLVGVMKG